MQHIHHVKEAHRINRPPGIAVKGGNNFHHHGAAKSQILSAASQMDPYHPVALRKARDQSPGAPALGKLVSPSETTPSRTPALVVLSLLSNYTSIHIYVYIANSPLRGATLRGQTLWARIEAEMFVPQRNRTLGFASCALASSLWGCGFFFGKIALAEMGVGAMVLYRFLFATLVLIPLLLPHQPRPRHTHHRSHAHRPRRARGRGPSRNRPSGPNHRRRPPRRPLARHRP